jgi:hypothetical protein
MDGGARREFEGYSRLAGKVHLPSMIVAVRQRLSSGRPEVVRRAERVRDVLKTNRQWPEAARSDSGSSL